MTLSTTTNLVWPWGTLLDSAVAYAGSPVNGATKQIGTQPTRLHAQIVLSAGSFSSNNVVVTLQTSPDGTNWYATNVAATFTANGVNELEVNVPILAYVRFAYSGAASGTVNVYLFASCNPTLSTTAFNVPPTDYPVNGFLLCNSRTALDAAATKAAAGGGTRWSCNGKQHRAFLVVTVAARTQGTIVVKLQFSFDGTTWYDSANTTSTLSANAVTVLFLANSIGGPYVRAYYTPGSSFDGTVGSTLYTDGAPLTAT